jgi:N-carbamoyl-L-amino-acid hydrolase
MKQFHRRSVLSGLLAGSAGLAWPCGGIAADLDAALRVDAGRLRQNIEDFSMFGRKPGGSFADGVSRFAYSDADIAGRKFAMNLLHAAGAEPRIDAAGNILARREGSRPDLKPIMIGSHIDSVPDGGNFDGVLGSMSAIEVLRTLNENRFKLRHPLEIALWSNEEGGLIGSGAAGGVVKPEILGVTLNGIRRIDGVRRIGGDPDHLVAAHLEPNSRAAYVELHIEQSGRLEKTGTAIAIVDGIVAIDEYEVEIIGFANHAGTTPMADRHNALLAAAKLIEAVQEEITREPGWQVGNVGHLEVYPNVRNIVPGRVFHTLELRDLDAAKVKMIGDRIIARSKTIATDTGTEIHIKLVEREPAAISSPALQQKIADAAKSIGLATMHLPSGATHDGTMLTSIAPIGMIFVPSVAGISHSPKELTSWTDCANGANVLLQTVLRLDRD